MSNNPKQLNASNTLNTNDLSSPKMLALPKYKDSGINTSPKPCNNQPGYNNGMMVVTSGRHLDQLGPDAFEKFVCRKNLASRE